MKPFTRTDRLNEEILRILSGLIEREVQDPRVGLVTVTGVEVARDLSVARIFVTVPDGQDVEGTLKGVKAAAGFLRSRLAEIMQLRSVPELRFRYDDSIERGIRMEALFRRLAEEREEDA
jgi:ribosome-binding factor A